MPFLYSSFPTTLPPQAREIGLLYCEFFYRLHLEDFIAGFSGTHLVRDQIWSTDVRTGLTSLFL